ncbi:ACP phosphodiesterase [Duffyella gerundensis]|uniref:ACP phosphodiesterase n=1 Tax=Duffyella gerundensis TaxID=1619313 RepID=UPI00165489B1|nr:ACP phosphodiesterase [Duffyella gerundensis]
MNFLAHLHLARLADSALLGNLMADYIRGNPVPQWPDAIAEGIALHRRIDARTDSLAEVREARSHFRALTRRVAPITLDVIWDHFLARHWQQISPTQSLRDFLSQAEAEVMPQLAGTPEGFQQLNHILWRERWMERYADAAYLQPVLNGMANRRPKLAALRDSYDDFVDNYALLERLFWQFYPRMMTDAQQKTL